MRSSANRSLWLVTGACLIATANCSFALPQSEDDDLNRPAGATRAPAGATAGDEKMVDAERRIAELEARVRELQAALAEQGGIKSAKSSSGPAIDEPETPGSGAAPEIVVVAEVSAPSDLPVVREVTVEPFDNPAALMQEIERRYVERFATSRAPSVAETGAFDSYAEEVALWTSRQNALLNQPIKWVVRVLRVEPSRRTTGRVSATCRGIDIATGAELGEDFRVELEGDSTRELLRQHPANALFVVSGTFSPNLVFSADHAESGPWHRSGLFVGPYCVAKWTVAGDSIAKAEEPAAQQTPAPEESPAEPAATDETGSETPVDPEPQPAPTEMPPDSDQAAAETAAAEEAARIAAAEVAASEEAARIAAETAAAKEAARIAAETAAAEVADAEAVARAAAEAAAAEEAARLALEAEARARDPLAHLTAKGRQMVERSADQLSRANDPTLVSQLVKGYEARLNTANADLKPAIEVILGNAKERLSQLQSSGKAKPVSPAGDAAQASTPK